MLRCWRLNLIFRVTLTLTVLGVDYRKAFDEWWKGQWKQVSLPEAVEGTPLPGPTLTLVVTLPLTLGPDPNSDTDTAPTPCTVTAPLTLNLNPN